MRWLALALVLFVIADLFDYFDRMERRITRLELERAGIRTHGPWGDKEHSNV